MRLVPKGHQTFDVFDDLNLRGSVWHMGEGWVARGNGELMLIRSGIEHATPEQAAEELLL